MSDSLVVCDVDPDLREKLRKFRFRKETNNAAILMKIDKEKQLVVLEEEFEDISPDDLQNELPERQPRFLVYSYRYAHDDGRISYPLCMIFSSPVGSGGGSLSLYRKWWRVIVSLQEVVAGHCLSTGSGGGSLPLYRKWWRVIASLQEVVAGCKPEQQMMYAGSKNRLVQIAELTKVFEIRTTSDLTEEWLKERLSFFR
ncbi:glia maturation factor gamma isoform X2 [Phyllobates terribilis]|uniref:glia maturation factor gamma isoform X2 n=1 Tax=Phyllobates terribilis TaxID=111132 RepID=UPI003CCB2B05